MLVHIQTFVLDTGGNAQAVKFLDTVEECDTASCSPEVDNQDTECLSTEESPAVTVESTVAGGEQAGHQSAENAADTVHTAGTDGVVDMQAMVDELNGKDEYCAADETDDNSSHGRDEVATGRDAHKTCQHAVERQGERGLPILEPGEEHRGHTACSCCEVGGEEHVGNGDAVDLTGSGELGAGVETEPTHPQDEHTESCECQRVAGDGAALAVLAVFAATGTQGHSTDDGQHPPPQVQCPSMG